MGFISRPVSPITEKENKTEKEIEALTVPDWCNSESNQSSSTTTL